MLHSICWRSLVMILSLGLALQLSTHAHAEWVTQQVGKPGSGLDINLQSYRDRYPDIMFLVLTGDDWVADMMTLDILLGYEPVSLDYEHPPHLREDLVIVSASRILNMLYNQAPSATLFKADEPQGWQETICVLTINAEALAADSVQATSNLLGKPREYVHRIPQNLHIQHDDFLAYAIDHEIYHCLQSKYIGPQKMSYEPLWADYHHHLNELGADAYALGMHIREKGHVTDFAMNVRRIRCTALSSSDPNHLTYRAADRVFEIPAQKLADMGEKDIFLMAADIRKQLDMGYDDYLVFLSSAIEVMNKLEVEPELSEQAITAIKDIRPSPAMVNQILQNTQSCLDELSIDD